MGLSLDLSTFIHLFFSIALFHLLFFNFTSVLSLPLCRDNERSALSQFKQSLAFDNCTYPWDYPKVASWKAEGENDDCCSWKGVTCNEFTGHVVKLDLPSSCLSGSINSSSSIFQLVHLESLNLAFNDFAFSEIPSGIMNLSRLSLLNLSSSYFSGQIPSQILNLSRLKSLDVSDNIDLELKKPSLGSLVEKLTDLEILDLSYANISSPVPNSVTNLSSLTHLSLARCNLQGEFPTKIFQLPNLRLLSLDYNWDLRGYLPEFGKNSSLEELIICGTNFSGEIPDSIGNLESLVGLELGGSYFSGAIPSSLGNLTQLTVLDLSYSNFSGQIPSEILNLSKLKYLDASDTNFLELQKPSLRSLVEKLTNLEILDLSTVDIPSSIPQSLTNLSSLTHLSLARCNLQGEFPAKIFQLPNLRLLNVAANRDLRGYLPEFGKNGSLEELILGGNNFSGEIPDSIGNLKSLVSLDIGDSYFSGTIPPSLVNLDSLQSMTFRWNNFSSQNSRSLSWISNLRKLSSLELSYINLVGEIPYWIMNLPQLTELIMEGNQLTGPIPPWLASMKQLTTLWLGNNQLTGRIPSEIGSLDTLYTLYLGSNQLEGLIPSSIFELDYLIGLDLGFNKLNGTLDLDVLVHKLKSLFILILSSNNLTLLTKTSVSTVSQHFQTIGLSSCNLRMFPNFLRNQDGLRLLDLSSNKIAGQIPSWFLNVSINSLELLNLSSNLLTGFDHHSVTLPWTVRGDFLRVTLDLSHNHLQETLPIPSACTFSYLVSNNQMTGEISPSICSLNGLHVLDLSDNNLTGMLPECLGNFSDSLLVLKLQGNRFHGRIPQTFMIGTNLRMLDLSNNLLQGRIPRSLMNCTKLEFLHLGSNQITDIFPTWLGTLPELKVLNLNYNRFHGIIEELGTGCDFPKLHIIDLSHNRFTGNLPSKFFQCLNAMRVVNASRLTYMQHYLRPPAYFPGIDYGYFDYSITLSNKGLEIEYRKLSYFVTAIILSSNEFAGEIPTSLGGLKGLHVLNLSNNNFQGHIPSCLGNLTVLESLDLSNNKLSGVIPRQLVELTSLELFDVSNNHLTGPIPQGKQFNTFENGSYDGNPGLCGKPLSKRCEISEAPGEEDQASSSPFAFGWKIVVIGYASGLIIGLVLGHIAITKKPELFAKTFGVRLKTLERKSR